MSVTLQLNGLHCQHCVKSVESALKALPTVSNVQIDLATQQAVVESQETTEILIEVIENIGFDAKQV